MSSQADNPPGRTADDREVLKRAAELSRPITRAASVARSNGACLLVFGAIGVLFALIGFNALDLAIAAAATAAGVVELRGARGLKRCDPAAARVLARNELALMAAIILYSVLKLTVLRGSVDELSEQLRAAGGSSIDLADLAESVNTLVYTTFIAVTVLYQGGLARYYSRRRAMIETYVRECPKWSRDVVGGL